MRIHNTKFTSLIGKEINSIKVIDVKIPAPHRHARARIICPYCKKEKWVLAAAIASRELKSCGCNRYTKPRGLDNKKTENLTGKIFGKLTVLKVDENLHRRLQWICQCECGNTKSVPSIYLKTGESSSCGCKLHVSGKNNPLWQGFEGISGKSWSRIKSAASKRNLKFSIDIKDIWNQYLKQNMKCALTGLPIVMRDTASLDRIDSSRGYEIDNIQWVHKKLNVMKWDLPQEDFVNFCRLVAKKFPESA